MKKTLFKLKIPEIVLIILVLISGTMLGFSSGGFVINFQVVGFAVISTFQKGCNAVADTVFGTFTALKDIKNLQSEYEKLNEKLKDYEYLQRNNAEIRRENELLREQLDFTTSLHYKNIAAQIIGRDPNSLYSGLTINKGARNGIKKDMPVIAIQDGNIGIVGKIIKVGIGTSMIMPVYDLKCNISARVQNTRDIGIVSGKGAAEAKLSLNYIRKRSLDELHYGDIIVTSGENGNYMRDIPIGTISEIRVLDYDNALEISLDSILDFSRLENVIVVDQLTEIE